MEIEKDKTMIVRITYLTKMLIDGDNIVMKFSNQNKRYSEADVASLNLELCQNVK